MGRTFAGLGVAWLAMAFAGTAHAQIARPPASDDASAVTRASAPPAAGPSATSTTSATTRATASTPAPRSGTERDPRENEGGEEGEGPVEPREADLFPTLPMANAAGWMLRPDPEPSSPEERGEEALDRYFDDSLVQDRQGVLGADGWYSEMGRDMRRDFHRAMQNGGMDRLERERRASMTPIQQFFDELGRYRNGPERPIDPVGMVPREVENSHFYPDEQAALGAQDQVNLLNAPVTWYRVDLHVVQNPEGAVSAVWVIRSSGYRSLDDAAMRAVHDGSIRLRPPPSRVTEGRDAIASEWAFEAGDVATYWTQAGCVDDPVTGDLDCAALGRGIVRTRIRLLRVIDGETESFEERRHRARESPPTLRGD